MQMSRPISAPCLLRGEGLLKQRTHEDGFLQSIETKSVHRCRDSFHREKFFMKDQMSQVDMLADPSLHDLRLLHNSSQRSKGSDVKRRHQAYEASKKEGKKRNIRHSDNGQNSRLKSSSSSLSDQIRELCQKLDANIQHHCTNFNVPEDMGLHRAMKRSETQNFKEGLSSLLRRSELPMI
jgi:hypothetical protein